MNKNQRKNRPKKKEIPEDVWANQLEDLKRKYGYAERKKQEEQQTSGHSSTE